MPGRKIDANLYVQKTNKTNTVIVHFTDRRLKRFVWAAKNKLRRTSEDTVKDLNINDNLTPYNYSMLITLKQETGCLRTSNKPYFETIYSFEDKVFVKKLKDATNPDAVHIHGLTQPQSFLRSYLRVNAASTSEEGLQV